MYAQLSMLDGVMILLGRKDPTLTFTILGEPGSVYINFEIKRSVFDEFVNYIDLPSEFELIPVRVLAGEEPAYLLTLNIYNVSGLASGSRAEWSTYVDDGDGRPRYMILEARSSSGSMDPVHIVTPSGRVDHMRNRDTLLSTVASGDGKLFRSEIRVSAKQAAAELATEWVAANDRIYWRNGVFDRAWYDGKLFDASARRVSGRDVQIEDETHWSRFVKRSPRHVLRYQDALEMVLSPWANVD